MLVRNGNNNDAITIDSIDHFIGKSIDDASPAKIRYVVPTIGICNNPIYCLENLRGKTRSQPLLPTFIIVDGIEEIGYGQR